MSTVPTTARPTDDLSLAVPDRGDAVQGALDAGAVILSERTDAAGDRADVLVADIFFIQVEDAAGEAGFGAAAQVEHHLKECVQVSLLLQRRAHSRREDFQQQVQVVGDVNLSGRHVHPCPATIRRGLYAHAVRHRKRNKGNRDGSPSASSSSYQRPGARR